jgi:hypothetical protein
MACARPFVAIRVVHADVKVGFPATLRATATWPSASGRASDRAFARSGSLRGDFRVDRSNFPISSDRVFQIGKPASGSRSSM